MKNILKIVKWRTIEQSLLSDRPLNYDYFSRMRKLGRGMLYDGGTRLKSPVDYTFSGGETYVEYTDFFSKEEYKELEDLYLPSIPPDDLLLIGYKDQEKKGKEKKNKDEIDYKFTFFSYKDNIGEILALYKRYGPKSFCTYLIEVSALWKFLSGLY